MRFDTPVTFVKTEEKYNNQTGNTEEVITERITKLANVSDTKDERAALLYGKVSIPAYTVIVRGSVTLAFNYLLIGDKKYTIAKERKLRLTTTYFVSG